MKTNRIFGILSGMALLLSGACSDDNGLKGGGDPEAGGQQASTGGVFLTVDFSLPDGNGTRSATVGSDGQSDAGTEVGRDEENNISSALIVLAAADEIPATAGSESEGTAATSKFEKLGFIVAGEVQTNNLSFINTSNFRALAEVQQSQLESFYASYGRAAMGSSTATEGPEVYVFVFSNPTIELREMFNDSMLGKADWVNKICKVIQKVDYDGENVGIWSSNSFLMNNVSLTTRALPKDILEWDKYSTQDNPFHLSGTNENSADNSDSVTGRGAVKVERSVARFDFKDGSGNNNTYDVICLTGEDGEIDPTKPIVEVQLQKMCLVNMCNEFYYLPRVSDDGLLTGDHYALCGREKAWARDAMGLYSGGNYVVGPYATTFKAGVEENFSEYFNFPFFDDNGHFNKDMMAKNQRWDVVKISDVLERGNPDQYAGGTHTAGEYRIWRYVTENVIPGIEQQKNGISTGVVFKGKILGTDYVEKTDQKEFKEEYWNVGYIKNLNKCLNGQPFIFNGVEHPKLTGDAADDPLLFYFNGTLYMGWRHIRQAAIQASVMLNTSGNFEINRSNSLYKAVFGDGPIPPTDKYVQLLKDGSTKKIDIKDPQWDADETSEAYIRYTKSADYAWKVWSDDGRHETGSDESGTAVADANLVKMRKAVTDAGITIYQSSIDEDSEFGAGYYCFYYYWNRHNDNGIPGTMGPMEFDVVRNNVYKLSVDGISRVGHPRIPENDPDDPKPDTPDESDEIYLDVSIKIVPWIVRLNSIQF